MKKLTMWGALILILVIGAIFYSTRNSSPNPAGGTYPNYKSISYEIDGRDVMLQDGVAEIEIAPGSASKMAIAYFGNDVVGDFNADGTDDIAFLLATDGGGSGTFFYVVAALLSPNGYVGTNAVLLGDRIAPQTTNFQNGTIVVNYAERKPGEPMTTRPSVGVSKYLTIQNGRLTETTQ